MNNAYVAQAAATEASRRAGAQEANRRAATQVANRQAAAKEANRQAAAKEANRRTLAEANRRTTTLDSARRAAARDIQRLTAARENTRSDINAGMRHREVVQCSTRNNARRNDTLRRENMRHDAHRNAHHTGPMLANVNTDQAQHNRIRYIAQDDARRQNTLRDADTRRNAVERNQRQTRAHESTRRDRASERYINELLAHPRLAATGRRLQAEYLQKREQKHTHRRIVVESDGVVDHTRNIETITGGGGGSRITRPYSRRANPNAMRKEDLRRTDRLRDATTHERQTRAVQAQQQADSRQRLNRVQTQAASPQRTYAQALGQMAINGLQQTASLAFNAWLALGEPAAPQQTSSHVNQGPYHPQEHMRQAAQPQPQRTQQAQQVNIGRQTGARNVIKPQDPQADFKAESRYDEVRLDNSDIAKIAHNTGWDVRRIERIKKHVFFDEHDTRYGRQRFDACADMYNAWNRLTKGDFVPNDLNLLKHEIFESKFTGIFKTDYNIAHQKTLDSGRPWSPRHN